MVKLMPNLDYNYSYELYAIRDSVINKSGFCISELPNPDRITMDNEEQRFGKSLITITLLWNSSMPRFLPDYRYILLQYKDADECLAYMMKATAINRVSYGESEAIFRAVLPDTNILKAVLEYREKTKYCNGVRRISEERFMFTNALENALNSAFRYGTTNTPLIKELFYNEPHTIVKWNDGTTTVVGCAEGEEFSKELGLSVAIAEKYFEVLGFPYPRAALKKLTENGHDQTAKTKARRDFKAAKKAKKIETEE